MAQFEQHNESAHNYNEELRTAVFRVVQEQYGNADHADNRDQLSEWYKHEKHTILNSPLFTKTVLPALRKGYTVIPYYPDEDRTVPFNGFLLRAPRKSGLEDIPVNFDETNEEFYSENKYSEQAEQVLSQGRNTMEEAENDEDEEEMANNEAWKEVKKTFLKSTAADVLISQGMDKETLTASINAYIAVHSDQPSDLEALSDHILEISAISKQYDVTLGLAQNEVDPEKQQKLAKQALELKILSDLMANRGREIPDEELALMVSKSSIQPMDLLN